MRGVRWMGSLVVAGAVVATSSMWVHAQSEGRRDFSGSEVFRTYCGACHGQSAKGDGPLAASFRRKPADLTEFAKRNGGVFDGELMAKIIDGRKDVKGHGGKDMPVWGDAFGSAIETTDESSIAARIAAVVKYLEGLQVK
ncbi:MAG: c-type cytochrome [Vicinamibacterales bacterium]